MVEETMASGSDSGSARRQMYNILVHGNRYGTGRMIDGHTKLFTIDLETKKVSACPHYLYRDVGWCSVVALGSVIYSIGGAYIDFHGKDGEPSGFPRGRCFHYGASYIDLSDDNQGWKSAAPPEYFSNLPFPCCVALRGKIYVFGFKIVRVYDPELDRWDPVLPPPDVKGTPLKVSTPALPDPVNNRILVHMVGNIGALYAYYPARDGWVCVIEDLSFWSKGVAFEDGVLYMYYPRSVDIVIAYDTVTKERLNVVLPFKFDTCVTDLRYDDLLHLGKGRLCLVIYSPEYGTELRTHVHIVNFSVERRTDSPRDIIVTPGSLESFIIEDVISHLKFVALETGPETGTETGKYPKFQETEIERNRTVRHIERETRSRERRQRCRRATAVECERDGRWPTAVDVFCVFVLCVSLFFPPILQFWV